jgi:hypothetical protein
MEGKTGKKKEEKTCWLAEKGRRRDGKTGMTAEAASSTRIRTRQQH